MITRGIALLILVVTCNTAIAEYETCHFEMVTHNVTVLETISAGELIQGGTPNQAAINELTDELTEMLANPPPPGYYQIRYYVSSFLNSNARIPVTICLEIEEGESVEDAAASDNTPSAGGGGSGEGVGPWEPPTFPGFGDNTVCGGGPSYSVVEPFRTVIICGHAPGGG